MNEDIKKSYDYIQSLVPDSKEYKEAWKNYEIEVFFSIEKFIYQVITHSRYYYERKDREGSDNCIQEAFSQVYVVFKEDLKNYNPHKATPLTYFKSSILQAIRETRKEQFDIPTPTHYSDLRRKIEKEAEQMGIEPQQKSAEYWATVFSQPIIKVKGAFNYDYNYSSIMVENEDGEEDYLPISSDYYDPELEYERNEQRKLISDIYSMLNEKELLIMSILEENDNYENKTIAKILSEKGFPTSEGEVVSKRASIKSKALALCPEKRPAKTGNLVSLFDVIEQCDDEALVNHFLFKESEPVCKIS